MFPSLNNEVSLSISFVQGILLFLSSSLPLFPSSFFSSLSLSPFYFNAFTQTPQRIAYIESLKILVVATRRKKKRDEEDELMDDMVDDNNNINNNNEDSQAFIEVVANASCDGTYLSLSLSPSSSLLLSFSPSSFFLSFFRYFFPLLRFFFSALVAIYFNNYLIIYYFKSERDGLKGLRAHEWVRMMWSDWVRKRELILVDNVDSKWASITSEEEKKWVKFRIKPDNHVYPLLFLLFLLGTYNAE